MFKNIKNPYLKNVLTALFVTALGFIMLNLTFLVYAVIINAIGLLFPNDIASKIDWYMSAIMTVISLGFIIGYWFIFRSKLSETYKAILMMVPTAIIIAMIGITFYRWPLIAYSIEVIVIAGILLLFYVTKQPWLYWFVVLIVSTAFVLMNVTGVEI